MFYDLGKIGCFWRFGGLELWNLDVFFCSQYKGT